MGKLAGVALIGLTAGAETGGGAGVALGAPLRLGGVALIGVGVGRAGAFAVGTGGVAGSFAGSVRVFGSATAGITSPIG